MNVAISVLVVIVISSESVAFANQIIAFCGSTVETHDMLVAYFRIIMGGMAFNVLSAAMMVAGMGMVPMAAHQVGMNILSLTFSFGDGMQVAAVALIGRSLGEMDSYKNIMYSCMLCDFCIHRE